MHLKIWRQRNKNSNFIITHAQLATMKPKPPGCTFIRNPTISKTEYFTAEIYHTNGAYIKSSSLTLL